MPEINVSKLTAELIEAGIQTNGCDSNGVVWDKDNNQIQDQPDVKAVINAHDPTPDEITILRKEYSKVGVIPEEMIFALWKKVMQSDSTDSDVLQSLMDKANLMFNQ